MKHKTIITVVLLVVAFVTQAQKQTKSFSKNETAVAMSLFVETVKPAYAKGQSYQEFEKALLGNWNNTPQGTALLTKAYQYIANGVTKEQIAKEYSGQEFTNALATNNALKRGSSGDGKELFGGTAKDNNSFSERGNSSACKWYNLSCYMTSTAVMEQLD